MDEQVMSVSPARGEPSLTPGEQRILAVLERFQQSVEQRLDRLELRMDKLELRLDRLEARMDKLEARMNAVEQRLDAVEQRLDAVEQRLDAVERRMDKLEVGQSRLEHRMTLLEHRHGLLDDGLFNQSKKLDGLISRIDYEGAASKQRDRQVLQSIERRHQEMDARESQLRTLLAESNLGLRRELSERLDQHNVRLEMLEQAVLQAQEGTRHTHERLRELHGEHRQLVTQLYARGLLPEPTPAAPPAA